MKANANTAIARIILQIVAVLCVAGQCLGQAANPAPAAQQRKQEASAVKSDTPDLINALYIAKAVYKVYRKDPSISDSSVSLKIMASIMAYANTGDADNDSDLIQSTASALASYPVLDSVFIQQYLKSVNIDTFFYPANRGFLSKNPVLIEDTSIRRRVKEAYDEYDALVKQIDILKKGFKSSRAYYVKDSRNNNISLIGPDDIARNPTLISQDIKQLSLPDTLSLYGSYPDHKDSLITSWQLPANANVDSTVRVMLQYNADDSSKYLNSLTSDSGKAQDRAKDTILKYAHALTGFISHFFPKKFPAPISNGSAELLLQYNKDRQDIYQTTNYLNTTTTTSGGLSLSQSQVIDALAIYIANRVKEEAVMWFFETISKNISKFELLRQFFPITTNLLLSHEVYEVPNMGSQWRYALSEDFVNMPRNVLSSQWVRRRWPESGKYSSFILGACDIGEMVLQHYNYRENCQGTIPEIRFYRAKRGFDDSISRSGEAAICY